MTGQRWIIDVLADLRTFAEQNGLPLLAAQLGDTAQLALIEIAQIPDAGAEGASLAGHGAIPLAVKGDNAGTRIVSGAGRTC